LLKRIDANTLGTLTDDSNVTADYTTVAAAAVITQAIADASAMIDSYVLGHLDMTDSDNTAAVEYHCAILALYYLHARKFASDDVNPKASLMRHTMKWLEGVRKRDLHVQTNAPLDTMVSTTSSTTKKFTDTSMSGFID
jgi:phage gp36-like protein